MMVRHAQPEDLETLAALEAACFPAAEAAGRECLRARINAFGDCFWLLTEDDGRIVSMVNGMATDEKDLCDAMYEDVRLHKADGAWQMIFGVDTLPEEQGRGYATKTLRAMLAETQARGRKGVVLTCKDALAGFYARLGFVDEGISASTHGNVRWRQMRCVFPTRN